MAAVKVTPDRGRPLTWDSSGSWARSRDPLEIGAAQVGEVVLIANLEVAAHWTFKLTYRGDAVYRLDVRPIGNHPNPVNRPAGFPRKAPEVVHEHVYVEGLNLDCARPLDDQQVSTHAAMFAVFLIRANLRFDPQYQSPPNVQTRLGPA